MGRRRALALGAVLGLASMWYPPATGPAGAAEMKCTFTYDLFLAPGIGSEPSTGTLRTDGKSGRYDCGHAEGDTGFDGKYGTAGPVTCASGGEGGGRLTYRFGFRDHHENIRFTFGAIKDGKMTGSFDGGSYDGKYTFTATEGGCTGNAVTRGKLVGTLTRK